MRRLGEEGFTLIELLFVIAVIAIIAAISLPNLLSAKHNANEVSAVAMLRNLVSAQALMGVGGRIDTDGDGKGEFGTFLEMSGGVGFRKGFAAGPPATSDFSVKGVNMNPPALSPLFSMVSNTGFPNKSGFAFMIFLPDGATPAGFVHETGPAASAGLSGPIGVDMSETTWCAYAQPMQWGATGTRRFFTNQKGDILKSDNQGHLAGIATPILGNSAFLGAGITSPVAIGATGNDGDVWVVAQ
jgi:prepilin-type N-terminal cleavage/methylation domain-containing protein